MRKQMITLLLAMCFFVLFLPSAILVEGASEPPEELVSSAEPDPTPLLTPEPIPSIHPSTAPPLDSQSDTELARLYIDNKHRYEKMERSYSQGYVPTVEKGVVTVILPLLCDGQLQGDCLRAKVGLGETTGPFVTKNYEKTVERTDQKVNDGKDKVSGYYVYFQLDLKQERFMGSYPVTISERYSQRHFWGPGTGRVYNLCDHPGGKRS